VPGLRTLLLFAPVALLGMLGGRAKGRRHIHCAGSNGAALVGTLLLTWFAKGVKAGDAQTAILLDLPGLRRDRRGRNAPSRRVRGSQRARLGHRRGVSILRCGFGLSSSWRAASPRRTGTGRGPNKGMRLTPEAYRSWSIVVNDSVVATVQGRTRMMIWAAFVDLIYGVLVCVSTALGGSMGWPVRRRLARVRPGARASR